jgi:3-oxoadipate enol-lactonase
MTSQVSLLESFPGLLLAVGLIVGLPLAGAGGSAAASRPEAPTPLVADTLEVDGGDLYYEVFGSGYPLVFIHEGLAHSEVWDEQVAAFAPGYRVIRYDRRGYGRSPEPDSPYSNVDDLYALFDALGLRRAVLVGSSSGGGLAINFALKHPDLVEALVLSGPVVDGLGYSYHFMKRAYANFGKDEETTLDLWIDDKYAVAPGNDAARERLRALMHANPHNMSPAKHGLARSPDYAALERLSEIPAPTLLIVGEHDTPDVHAHVGAIEAGIAGARRVVVDSAGHMPYLERPESFNHAVGEFLSLLSLAPDSPRVASEPVEPWAGFVNGFAPVDGTSLYYEVIGAGDPVVLLHGGAIDHRMWDEEFASLAGRRRVVRYDMRGHGLSKSPFGTYSHREDLAALLGHLGIERAHLVGLSLGCRVAVDFAISNPQAVLSLVLCSPGVSGYDFNAPEEQDYLTKIRAAWGAADFEQAAEEFVRAWADGPHRSPDQISAAVREKVKRMAVETVRPDRDLGSGVELDPPAWGRLGEVSRPTLAILGALDMPGIHEIVSRMGDEVPNCTVETVSGVAHMVNLERPDEFNRLVSEFLEEHAGR